MNQTAIAVQDQKAIETADEMKFRQMCGKLKHMISNGRKLSDPEVYALAQFSTAEKLDPFNKECWYIPGVGPSIGIRGIRKKAQEALNRIAPGHYFKVVFYDVTKEYQANDPKIGYAFRAVLKDTLSSSKYLSLKAQYLKDGLEKDEIVEVLGEKPEWEAVGFWNKGEANDKKDKFFLPEERAKKRAEALVISKRFNIPYDAGQVENVDQEISVREISSHQLENGVVEGEFNNGEIQETTYIRTEIDSQYDTDYKSPDQVKLFILGIAEDLKAAGDVKPVTNGQKGVIRAALQLITAPGDTEMKRHQLLKFIFDVSSSRDLTDAQWRALGRYLVIEKIDTGEYKPKDPIIEREIRNILAYVDSNEKQPAMF